MIHIENEYIREHLLDGNFGLEKESLRVLEDGSFSHAPHPFEDDEHIVKDFCENQAEINTDFHTSIQGAAKELREHNRRLIKEIGTREQREYLWLFSNPPFIKDEEDIPVAKFDGLYTSKTFYRNYLADKYGRYKMTFSGIHFNYSFSDEMLQKDFLISREKDFDEYRDRLYLNLAKGLVEYGWIMVAVTAASPVLDGSFLEKGKLGESCFTGMASVRCSELGYWNEFVPVLDYESLESYAKSIQRYVDEGLLNAPSELYYPIRLKSKGENNLRVLSKSGVNHIELRMFDLNPLVENGIDERDIFFAQLLILWIASEPQKELGASDQVRCVRNFKMAAHFDLETTKLIYRDGESLSMEEAGKALIERLKEFYADFSKEVMEVLDFEYEKFADKKKRYAWIVRERFSDYFAEKALRLARERQVI